MYMYEWVCISTCYIRCKCYFWALILDIFFFFIIIYLFYIMHGPVQVLFASFRNVILLYKNLKAYGLGRCINWEYGSVVSNINCWILDRLTITWRNLHIQNKNEIRGCVFVCLTIRLRAYRSSTECSTRSAGFTFRLRCATRRI